MTEMPAVMRSRPIFNDQWRTYLEYIVYRIINGLFCSIKNLATPSSVVLVLPCARCGDPLWIFPRQQHIIKKPNYSFFWAVSIAVETKLFVFSATYR